MFEINRLKTQLSGEFETKDLGEAKKILGMEIRKNRKPRNLYLSQKNYFENVLKHFKMHDSKPMGTPLANHFKLSADLLPQTEDEYMSHVLYASVIESLMYGMIYTHYDISHVVSVVSGCMECLGKAHWKVVKWIFQYLRGTANVGLMFDKTGRTADVGLMFDKTGGLDGSKSRFSTQQSR